MGSASGTPTTLRFMIFLVQRNQTAITSATLQPIVDALVAAGADRDSIQDPINDGQTGNRVSTAQIYGSSSHPTPALLTQLIAEMGTQTDASISNAQVTLRIDDCAAVAEASRADGIRRARERAAASARDLGLRLGAVLSAIVSAPFDASGSCESTYGLPYPQMGQGPAAFAVRVTTPVTLRFAIR